MGFDFTDVIDARCGTINNHTTLSIASGISTSFLMLFTIPLNAVVVFVLIKDRKKKRYQNLFYKLLLNIAIVDLLTGLVVDPGTINFFVKEAMHLKMAQYEVYLAHLPAFLTDAIALSTLTLLSIDRIVAIISTVKHFQGMRKITCYILVASSWIFGACLVLSYFKIGYIRQLFVFTIINITVTVISLIVTMITYMIKLKPTSSKYEISPFKDNLKIKNRSPMAKIKPRITKTYDAEKENAPKLEKITNNTLQVPNVGTVQASSNNLFSKQARIQKKATRAFLIMLCVFVATYLPTAVTMIFMNVCTTCNCMAIHIMRDISLISILSSSVFRPLNFILTLKHLRMAVCYKFGRKKYRSKDDTITSGPSGSKITAI